MSTKKPILSAALTLTLVGLLGLASADPADPGPAEPSGASPATAPGGPGEGAAPAPSAEAQGVILLTDGQVIQGIIIDDESGCLLKTPLGSKRFPRRRIEKTFRTVREAYEYKLSQFPEEDTDERLKLAQWCLAQNLQEEAKAQLNEILKISPKNPPAKAMLEKIEQADARKARRQIDPGIQRAEATSEDMTEDSPKPLDPATLERARYRAMPGGIVDVPDIFNLPRPMALRITEEFNRSVHPILQAYCAKCHNDRYPGDFQLRQIRSPRDKNRDTSNLNLEATLQLIDPTNPSKSELLSSSLRPHGGYGKQQRAIFRSSNEPAYQKLSHWVNSVCKPLKSDAVRQAAAQAGPADGEEQFAADRSLNLGEAAAPLPPSAIPNRRGAADGRRVRGSQAMPPAPRASAAAGGGPDEFPLVDFTDVNSMRAATAARTPSAPPRRTAPDAAGPHATAKSSTPPPDRPQARADAGLPELPPEANPTAPATTKKKKAPPVKLDPALLEGVLKARNAGN